MSSVILSEAHSNSMYQKIGSVRIGKIRSKKWKCCTSAILILSGLWFGIGFVVCVGFFWLLLVFFSFVLNDITVICAGFCWISTCTTELITKMWFWWLRDQMLWNELNGSVHKLLYGDTNRAHWHAVQRKSNTTAVLSDKILK